MRAQQCQELCPATANRGWHAIFSCLSSQANSYVVQQADAIMHKALANKALLNQQLPHTRMKDWVLSSPVLSWVQDT